MKVTGYIGGTFVAVAFVAAVVVLAEIVSRVLDIEAAKTAKTSGAGLLNGILGT